ncbi:hypothetical protein HYH02_008010 [Chlamydomonas schloesseri]|uniref:Uncharacterized protein n=1 Tax=Chlamydomonas schloesseri TaxID=2026947 RepID=A0A835WGE6_9CHLO|nr:hypothetical protein HYH02_008010 [Chlamydomonas schloesseri]|eukprot:KAG2446853.1 hypothetical protein HYH02_008010 [Chlamydomonas schloesseri]
MEGNLKLQSDAVAAACRRFQSVVLSGQLSAPTQQNAPAPPAPCPASHPSVDALTALLLEQQELLARLAACGVDPSGAGLAAAAPQGTAAGPAAAPPPTDGTAGAKATGAGTAAGGPQAGAPSAVDEATAELVAAAGKRERVLGAGLQALGALASSLRGVLDDVAELAPEDNGYTPSVKELLEYGHRLRYTTFATTGLFAGEPAPQQLHLDHAALWERALAERHAAMAAAAAPASAEPADPATEAACVSLLENLVAAGWSPEQGFPEPVVAFLSDMPGAMDVLRRLVEVHFAPAGAAAAGAADAAAAGAAAGVAAAPAPAAAALTAAPPPAAASAAAAAAAANPASRLVHQLMLDEDSDDDGSGSEYTTTEDGSD